MKCVFVFDVDGTLLDSIPVLRGLACELISQCYQVPIMEAGPMYDATVGRPFVDQLHALFPYRRTFNREVAARYTVRHAGYMASFTTAPQIWHALAHVKEEKHTTIAVSSTAHDLLMRSVALMSLPIDEIRGKNGDAMDKLDQLRTIKSRYCPHGKPPEPLLWYFGDSLVHDGEIAKFVNAQFVHVTIATVAAQVHRALELSRA